MDKIFSSLKLNDGRAAVCAAERVAANEASSRKSIFLETIGLLVHADGSIDVNTLNGITFNCNATPNFGMNEAGTPAVHVWLVLSKAFHAITRKAKEELDCSDLSEADFRVLEVLLHKGPQPVNTIGPRVHLTPGSISVAVERLHARGLVSRVESPVDRRVRTVALTREGEKRIVPVFRRRATLMEEIMAPLSELERTKLESALKAVGRNAEKLLTKAVSRRRA